MNLRSVASEAMTVVALTCAVTVTVLVVRKEIFHGGVPAGSGALETPRMVNKWAELSSVGHRMGPADAKVVILEFADFECPACRKFTGGALKAIRSRYPEDVAVVFRHWPLSYHRFAYPAARASECAAAQGRFREFHDLVYEQQDSLGFKSMLEFGVESGVSDSVRFGACLGATGLVPAVDRDILAAQALGARGTPAVIVNGRYFAAGLDSARLTEAVEQALLKSPLVR